MPDDRWQRVKELLGAALERPAEARGAYLREACGSDEGLRREVESLLSAQGQAGAFLSEPADLRSSAHLPTGTRLGPYEVVSFVGAGGMGEVYKARDTRLDRTVAIKMLPGDFAADPERARRFEREARTISKLNHPHICALYDVGQYDGSSFLVMEYLEGENLAERLTKGALSLEEALRYARQIAEALAEAHQQGIIHRDLKPANVMLTRQGAKLLDFGIAKLRAGTVAEDAATATRAEETAEGVIVGTPQYMAPEQLEGKPVDARTDVFAFGVVLYEMVTGKKAFEAPSQAGLIAAILERDPPPLSRSQPLSPPWLEALVQRCLAKRPPDRWPTFAELLGHLEGRLAAPPPRRFTPLGALAAILAAAAVIGLVVAVQLRQGRRPGPDHEPVLRRLTADAGLTTDPALSPDGRLIAYASDRAGEGNLDIWVQQVAGGEPVRLTRHPADETTPHFSPDGTQIAFRSERDGGGIYVVSALGGEARLVAPQGYNPRFSPNGRWIAYHTGLYNVRAAGIPRFAAGKLYIVPPSGGPPRQIQATAKSATYSIWSPDSDRLLTVGSFEKGIEADEWWVAPLEGPAVQVRLDPLNDQGLGRPYTSSYVVYPTAWLPGNRIVFSAFSGDSRNSWTVTLSPKTWQIDGPAQRLTSGAGIEGATSVTFAGPDMLRLAFANIAENIDLWSAPLDHAGMPADQLVRLTDDAFPDAVPTLTADGRTLVFASARQGPWELWARDLTSKRETKLVSMAPDWLFKPVLSSDGSRLAFWRQDNDGRPAAAFVTDLAASSDGTLHTGNMRELPALAKEGAGWPWSWTPDGKALWYDTVRWPRLGPNHLYDVATGQAVAEFVHPQHDLTNLLVSPDSRWLLFTEVLSESVERLVVTPMKDGRPAGERDWIPLTGGDTSVYWPAWSVSGDAVYFTSDRDGFVCVWKQRVSGGMRLLGEPVAIHHAHSARLSIAGVGHNRRGLAAARDKVVFNMSEIAGNIWMAELQDRP